MKQYKMGLVLPHSKNIINYISLTGKNQKKNRPDMNPAHPQ